MRDGNAEPVSTHGLVVAARVEACDDDRVAIGLANAWRLVTAAGVVQLAASVFAGAVGVRLCVDLIGVHAAGRGSKELVKEVVE